jgi:hypothetical protein
VKLEKEFSCLSGYRLLRIASDKFAKMKKLIFLFLAIVSLTPAAKLPAHTLYADQLAYIDEQEAELNKVWAELSVSQRNALRAEEKRWIAWKDTLGLGDKMEALEKRITYLKSFLK